MAQSKNDMNVLELMMPIGYMFHWTPTDGGPDLSTAEKVASYFGFGTWETISSGRVLMGADENHVAGSTSEAGLPNITGSLSINSDSNNAGVDAPFSGTGAVIAKNTIGSGSAVADTGWGVGSGFTFDASKSNSIYGNSDTVQPPAYYCYIYRRIA